MVIFRDYVSLPEGSCHVWSFLLQDYTNFAGKYVLRYIEKCLVFSSQAHLTFSIIFRVCFASDPMTLENCSVVWASHPFTQSKQPFDSYDSLYICELSTAMIYDHPQTVRFGDGSTPPKRYSWTRCMCLPSVWWQGATDSIEARGCALTYSEQYLKDEHLKTKALHMVHSIPASSALFLQFNDISTL